MDSWFKQWREKFYKKVNNKIHSLLRTKVFEKNKEDAVLRDIDTINIIPYNVYKENEDKIKKLISDIKSLAENENKKKWEYIQELQKFHVPVYKDTKRERVKVLGIKPKSENVEISKINYNNEIGIFSGKLKR